MEAEVDKDQMMSDSPMVKHAKDMVKLMNEVEGLLQYEIYNHMTASQHMTLYDSTCVC